MTRVTCRNKMCKATIAFINGTPPEVKCEKCGRRQRLYYEKRTQAIRSVVKFTAA